jgi:hypothetical protein
MCQGKHRLSENTLIPTDTSPCLSKDKQGLFSFGSKYLLPAPSKIGLTGVIPCDIIKSKSHSLDEILTISHRKASLTNPK